jgi:DNA-binding transcriptional LysR family regulator
VAVPLTSELRWVIVGSPDYLARHGRPAAPEDLLGHSCVRMRIGDNSLYRWELGDGARMREIDVPGRMSANETETSVQAAINGVGLAYCLEMRVAAEVRAGTLEIVLPEWSSMGPPFCMYYPSRRQMQPGLRELIEMIRTARRPAASADDLSARRRRRAG